MDKKKFCFRQGEFYFVGRRDGDCNHRVHPYVRFGSSETVFNPDVFSVRRIKVAPIVCLFGFLFIIYAILRKPAYTPLEEENEGSEKRKTKCPVRTPRSIRIKHGCNRRIVDGPLAGPDGYLPVSSSGHLAIASHFSE